jgi:hypothetical protein
MMASGAFSNARAASRQAVAQRVVRYYLLLSFPSANTTAAELARYPSWTGVQNLSGYSYVPQSGDTIKNGLYRDFANYVQTYPTKLGQRARQSREQRGCGPTKELQVIERIRLQLRVDVFNAFNHPRFGAPDTNPGDSTFGRVTPSRQNQARTVELGAHVSFLSKLGH